MIQVVGYFSVAAIVIALAIFFRAAYREAHKEALLSDRMNFVVRPPRMYRVVGVICAAFFGAILVISSFTASEDLAWPFFTSVFAGFLVLGGLLVYYTFRWKLVVAEDRIELTPVFGIIKTYSIWDVTHIKADPTFGVRAYSHKKRLFSVDNVSVGCGMLIAYFIEKGVKTPERINLPHQ